MFVVLVLVVLIEHRVAENDFNDDDGVVIQNDEAVEGEELLGKLLAANDSIIVILLEAAPLPGARPLIRSATPLSLRIVRGLEPRAPPSRLLSA